MTESTDPLAGAYAAYEQFEAKLSSAMDHLVATNGFAELFTTSATTMMALTRMANGAIDQAMRTTRLAVRHDVTSLARQLARTEDKLERMLQAIEAIEDRLDAIQSAPGQGSVAAAPTATHAGAADGRSEAPVPLEPAPPDSARPEPAPVKRTAVKRAAVKKAAAKKPTARAGRSAEGTS